MFAAGGLAASRPGFPERPRAELSQGWSPSPGEGFQSLSQTRAAFLSRLPVAIACTAGAGLSSHRSTSPWVGLGKNPRKVEGGRRDGTRQWAWI